MSRRRGTSRRGEATRQGDKGHSKVHNPSRYILICDIRNGLLGVPEGYRQDICLTCCPSLRGGRRARSRSVY
jgi:hypothetical protein